MMRAPLLPLLLLILFACLAAPGDRTSQAVEPTAKPSQADAKATPKAKPAKEAKQVAVAKAEAPAPRKMANFSARDFRGKDTSLDEVAAGKPVVVAFIGAECPLAKLYAPRLGELAREYEKRGIAFIGVDSNRQDSNTEIGHYVRVHNINFPVLKDVGNVIADQFAAERTPEVYLLDKDHVIRYQGQIDDQYGLGNSSGYAQLKVRRKHLVEAMDELLAGKSISVPKTEAPGCLIGRVREVKKDSPVTYSNQVARILQKNCLECHREGQIAPLALTKYDEVAGWAEMIEEVVRDQRMPPWHADPHVGKFLNDRSLSDEDKETLYAWVKAGAPEGDPKDLPAPVDFPETWQLGKPEQVVYMNDKPYDVPAEGTVEYQYFMVDPGWTEDRWIKASEILMGNRALVHHVFVFAVSPENPLWKLNGYLGHGVQPGIGDGSMRLIGGAAPGTPPATGPKGAATRVAAGTKLLFQMHYTPNGVAQQDRTAVGFVFTKPEEVTREVEVHMAINPSFNIPAGADNHPVESGHKFMKDTLIMDMSPHMHLRGKAFKYDLKYPDGKVETILDVPRYDFNWQVTYHPVKPIFAPAGSELRCLAHFDNSEHNLANPDPKIDVTWGEQTWEEMMIGWFTETTDVYPDDLPAGQTRTARFLAKVERDPPKAGAILNRAAGVATKSETGLDRYLDRLQKELPQIDRVCVTVVDNDEAKVTLAAQPFVFDASVGAVGATFPAADSAIARALKGTEPVVNADLSKVEGKDVAKMGQVLGSSVHFPITVEGKPAVISYWSKEKDAFPAPAFDFLRQVTKLVDDAN